MNTDMVNKSKTKKETLGLRKKSIDIYRQLFKRIGDWSRDTWCGWYCYGGEETL